MLASIGQAVVLATYANAVAHRKRVVLDEATNPWFQHYQPITFGIGHSTQRPKWKSTAAWLKSLRWQGVGSAYVWFEPVPPNVRSLSSLLFFGSERWAPVTVERKLEIIWHERSERDDTNADRPLLSYRGGFRVMPGQTCLRATAMKAHQELSEVIGRLLRFDADHPRGVDGFSNRFRNGLELLDSSGPWPQSVESLFPPGMYPTESYRLAAAVDATWCMGGMGRWDDWGDPDATVQAEFDALNLDYYTAVGKALYATTNVPL